MAAPHEPTPSLASSSRSSLTSKFKSRRKKRDNASSTHSLASNDTGADGLAASGELPRPDTGVDGGILEKIRTAPAECRRASQDSSDGKRFGSLLKRRKTKTKKEDHGSEPDELLGAGSGRRGSLVVDESLYANGNASDSSLLHKSVASSLLTEDSEPEGNNKPPRRPSLSPHDSHVGYLTLSSPLISSEAVESGPRDSTSADTVASEDTLAPRHAKTLDISSSAHRSSSPVNKLKDAFVPTRRSTTPKPVVDADSAKPSANGSGGLGGLFGAGKKGFGSKRGTKPAVDDQRLPLHHYHQPLAESPESITTPEKRRPVTLERLHTDPPSTPPNHFDAPQTLVTPPTPTDHRPATAPSAGPIAPPPQPTAPPPPVPDSASQKASPASSVATTRPRSATNPPSKLSNSISAPLSPTIEEAKTPNGGYTTPAASGFFSSAFSAIQNATTSLSNTITNSGSSKANKSAAPQAPVEQEKSEQPGGEEVILPASVEGELQEKSGTEKRQLAIETLGSGNLSLSHLGIPESLEASPMTSKTDLSEAAVAYDTASAKAEDNAASQAISAAYAADVPLPPAPPPPAAHELGERSRSTTGGSGFATPPRTQSTGPESTSIKRSGSIRSRVSGGKSRRHRGSSAATGNTIAAAISATTAALTNPTAHPSGPRLTGFAVASPKRNRDFHQLFRSVPEDDYLIEDYSAALQRDILLQGRLYVSEGHVCFSSNILGWVTNLVISFDEVVSVEKKNTAVIFPNAIVIQTLHARNVFASFVTRDSTYDLLIGIWKISHPNLKSSLNGVTLDAGTGDKTEKADSVHTEPEEASSDGTDDEVYDEDAEEEEAMGSFMEADGSVAGSEDTGGSGIRKASAGAVTEKVQNGTAKVVEASEAVVNAAQGSQDFPGPATHAPTECGDGASHYDKELVDTIIPAPLGKIHSLMFGPASGAFMRKWLLEDQKSLDLQMEDDKHGLGDNKKTFNYTFVKPLNAPIGPKQTKCIINQTLEQYDLEKAVTVSCSTQNPDVPNGNIFVVKTRYCLMWAPNNSTRLVMNCTIEWSGKSWIKGAIEKGANDGQTQYAKDLVAALRAAVSAKPSIKASAKAGKGKGKKKKESADLAASTPAADEAAQQAKKEGNWGLLEPLRKPLGPVVDALGGMGLPVLVVVLGVLVVYVLGWSGGRGDAGQLGRGLRVEGLSARQRVALYEDLWRREEDELWRWLEERVAMDRAVRGVEAEGRWGSPWGRMKGVEEMQQRLGSEAMAGRQLDEAIRVTQEKLDVLKEAVEKKKEKKTEKGKEKV